MLYILHGPDIHKARKKAHALVENLLVKKPHAGHFRFDDDTFDIAQLEEYIGGQGLFAERSLIVLDRTFDNEEAKEVIMEKVKQLAGSDNIFILVEEKIEKKHLTRLNTHAEKVELFQGTKSGTPKNFDIFSLTDAFGNRDKRKLWTLYQRAQRSGIAPEEMYNILFWQLKVMLQIIQGEENGLKPFVISKAKRFTRHYSQNELAQLSSRFVSLYHDARRGILDFGPAFESLILTLS